MFSAWLHRGAAGSRASWRETYASLTSWIIMLSIGLLHVVACTLASVDVNNAHNQELNFPSFDQSVEKNVSTQIEQTVRLICRINNLSGRTVSWIRKYDNRILTIGGESYTLDTRFTILRTNDSRDWILQIKYPSEEDAGEYECQASTNPKITFTVHLQVLLSKAQLSGPDLVDIGDRLRLTCNITVLTSSRRAPGASTEFVPEVTWSLNQSEIQETRGRTVQTTYSRVTSSIDRSRDYHVIISKLLLKHVRRKDAGVYACRHSAKVVARHNLRVTKERKPAQLRSVTSSCPPCEVCAAAVYMALLTAGAHYHFRL